ncbi:exocyst complex component EXO70B1-like [Aegilops tauschii subsp. strangulata]|uniref:Exocyst subunit Exo70 family protein n=1 Tax=Aegilops tauschii subsp. strangulata TaxID=200361 RepID=A0A452XG56_AEGTS|nr:uncharacterized protein LOC109785573 [Aegilops tauschii subsp. strangulata]
MAGRLASVPEGTTATDVSAAPCPASNPYRDSIRGVALPRGQYIRSNLFTHSGHSGSSFSGASSYYPSNDSGSSSGWASAAAAADLGTQELTVISYRMVTDGYTQRMVQAFEYGGDPDRALEIWFFELDVDWVLQMREQHVLRRELPDMSASSLQDLVGRWIRALTVIVFNIRNLAVAVHKMPPIAVAQFGKASVSAMLVFVNAILTVPKTHKLRAVVDMFICVSSVSYYMFTTLVISPEAKSIFSEIGGSLEGEGNTLLKALCSMMEEVRTFIEDDDSWAVEILQGRGEVHRNTRLMVDCIMSMKMTCTSARRHSSANLRGLVDYSVDYLKDVLLRKSELCPDLSMRYLFLLNNSYFIVQVSEPSGDNHGIKLTPECEKYMDSYLDASWGHVLPCISKSNFPGLLCCWINTSSHTKFESAFYQTYNAQKFWKVPDPLLRDALRIAITKRVISGYHNYLDEHPELKKQVRRESSGLDVLKEMLGQIFEG